MDSSVSPKDEIWFVRCAITFQLASTIWYYVLTPDLLIGFRVTNLWNMTLRSCVDRCQRFGGTCCFRLRKVCHVYGDSSSSGMLLTIHQALCRHKTVLLIPTVVTTTALFCSLCSVALNGEFLYPAPVECHFRRGWDHCPIYLGPLVVISLVGWRM